jgi:hypothetical protein
MHYTYVLRSERDGLFYTDSASNLRARLSQHRNRHVRSTAHRRPLALIYWSGSRIAVTSASECVRRGSQACVFTPVILSAANTQRGEAEAPSLSRRIFRQDQSSNRSSPYATSVASLRGDGRFAAALNEVKGLGITSSVACGSGRRKECTASAALGMTGKSSRELERY